MHTARSVRRSAYPRPRVAGSVLLGGSLVWLALTMVFASAGSAATKPVASVSAAPAAATPAAGSGWIRFGHFVTSASPVDVKVDGAIIYSNLGFRDVTGYVMVKAGVHTVSLVSATAPSSPVVSAQVTVVSGGAVTVAAVASPSTAKTGGIALQSYPDNLATPAAGQAKVRIIYTVPGTPKAVAQLTAATVKTAADALGIGPVTYGEASPYVSVAAGTYQVVVKGSSGGAMVEGVNWPVASGTVSSIVVIDATTGPTLEVLADAVGTANAPTGGMQTGLGGTAPRPTSLIRSALTPAVAALGILLAVGVLFRLRLTRNRA